MNDDIIKEFEGRITAVEQSTKQAHRRIDDVDRLTESVYTLATETRLMREELGQIKGRLETIEQRPGKRWDVIITAVIAALASGALGYILH